LPTEGPNSGVARAFVGEWRRVLADRGVFSMLIIAPVFYGVVYPQPYLGQLVRKIPIAVVDDDRSALSRRLMQTIEAASGNWASFNMREDQFGDLQIGAPVELVPSARSDHIQARVSEMVPRGEFATWRAARVVGDHDLSTFLVLADLVGSTGRAFAAGDSGVVGAGCPQSGQ
jgi:hypothetical protein